MCNPSPPLLWRNGKSLKSYVPKKTISRLPTPLCQGCQMIGASSKFTVNVWKKSGVWCSMIWGRLTMCNFYELRSKDTYQKMLPIKFEEWRLTEKWGILFLVFHTNASKFSCEQWLCLTDKIYGKNQNLNLQLSSWGWHLYFVVRRDCSMSTFLKLLNIKLLTFPNYFLFLHLL